MRYATAEELKPLVEEAGYPVESVTKDSEVSFWWRFKLKDGRDFFVCEHSHPRHYFALNIFDPRIPREEVKNLSRIISEAQYDRIYPRRET